MISPEATAVAAQYRHYAMCKIDFLGTGLSPAGAAHHYVAYYPQGRMDICHALASGLIPVTEGLVHIAHTCTLCGICDLQCHFVTEMRPLRVMRELKEHVEAYVRAGNKVEKARERTGIALQQIHRCIPALHERHEDFQEREDPGHPRETVYYLSRLRF